MYLLLLPSTTLLLQPLMCQLSPRFKRPWTQTCEVMPFYKFCCWIQTPIFCFICLLLFYILAIRKVISGRVPTCDSAHSWWIYNVAPLANHVTSTTTWYSTQPDRIMWLSGILGHDSGCLISMLGSTIKSLQVCTVTIHYFVCLFNDPQDKK